MLIYIHGTYCQYTYVNYIYNHIYIYTLRQAAEDQDPDLDRLLEALLEAWVIMDMSPRKKGGMLYSIWLVVWNMAFIFLYIGNVIIPTDFHIIQRG